VNNLKPAHTYVPSCGLTQRRRRSPRVKPQNDRYADNSLVEHHLAFYCHNAFWYCSPPTHLISSPTLAAALPAFLQHPGIVYQRQGQDVKWLSVDLEGRNSKLTPFYKYDVSADWLNVTGTLESFQFPFRALYISTSTTCAQLADSHLRRCPLISRASKAEGRNSIEQFHANISNKDLATTKKTNQVSRWDCTISPVLTPSQLLHIIPQQNAKIVRDLN